MSTSADTTAALAGAFRDGRVEHITLESPPEGSPVGPRGQPRNTMRSFTAEAPRRGVAECVSFLDEHRLGVRRATERGRIDYELDLRFLDPVPTVVRIVPWGWLSVAAGIAVSAALTLASGGDGLLAVVAGLLSALMVVRHTRTRLDFRSTDGRVVLFSTARSRGEGPGGQAFLNELAAAVVAARFAWPQTNQAFLRDQMREHHRLFEEGVLARDAYEAARASILAAH